MINVAGSDAQKAELLPQLAAGEMLLALALEESHKHNPYGISTTATANGDGYTLDGSKTFVLDGHVADKLIVVARSSRGGVAARAELIYGGSRSSGGNGYPTLMRIHATLLMLFLVVFRWAVMR